jgi:2-polyprenyl-6-methoxyphenol hydroxylase-like FAD-dependent oxidoreductase
MVISDTHTKVLIVGAGPSGMMMAAQLLRYGLQPLIIDSKDGPTTHSKALAVQARSLEIYRQMGVIDKVLANSKPAQGVTFNHNGKQQAHLSLNNVGQGLTPFPYLLMYLQSKNERLLLDYLTQNCCPVYWNTTLTALQQNTAGVQAQLKNNDGEYTLTCDWVTGADGAHSTVRKQLQIPFNGDTYPHYFYLVDARLDAPPSSADYVNLYMGDNGFAGFFPMPEENSYRIIGNLPQEFGDREDIDVTEILPYLDETTQSTIKIVKNNWFTTYKLHAHPFAGGRAGHEHRTTGCL